jgi:hypothetical protein
MDMHEQLIQERLDSADPYLIEFFHTCTDEKLMELMDKRTAELEAPLLKHSHSARQSIKDYLMVARNVMALRSIQRLRRKEMKEGYDPDAGKKGISLV